MGKLKIRQVRGIIVALVILLLVEYVFHEDAFLYNYRSVFAAGRLMEKLDYINKTQPDLIFVGNSRIDNGIDPLVARNLSKSKISNVLNLGIPGSNTRIFQGIVNHINNNKRDRYILIGLDPSLFTLDEELAYSVFFADRQEMWMQNDFKWLFASVFRLWGFSTNLKGLREPEKLIKFTRATFSDVDAWGGSVVSNKGYRAEDGVLSHEVQKKEHFKNKIKLNTKAINYFKKGIENLQQKGFKISIFFPLVYRKSGVITVEQLFEDDDLKQIKEFLVQNNIDIIENVSTKSFTANDFFNPGHLNKIGAQKYTHVLMNNFLHLKMGVM